MAPKQTPMNYVFGYGSLIERASRTTTTPSAWAAYPVIVDGIARGWWGRGGPIGAATCFLSAMRESGSSCNGVIYPVSDLELEAIDRREGLYDRVKIEPERITFLDGRKALASEADVWFYAQPEHLPVTESLASPEYPIVQSYVDICLNGCLEIETLYPLAQDAQFARMFVMATRDWSRYWINDRAQPRRPSAALPRAFQIDTILRELLPEVFTRVQFEPGNWHL